MRGGVRCCWLMLACWWGMAHAQTAAEHYQRWATRPTGQPPCLQLGVDLESSPGFSMTGTAQGGELRYRMAFNNVAEAWSWQPQARPDQEDYYRYKFFPLQSEEEEREGYVAEDKIGSPQQMHVVWHYDYFLAFDNLYEFYPRAPDDEAGFVLHIEGPLPAKPVMRATACLDDPAALESTTFWKAIHGNPRDFTLKKRYLKGHLQAIEFLDANGGRLLGTIRPRLGRAF